MQNPFQKNHIVIRPVSTVSVQKVVSLKATPVHKTVNVQIPSPPIQQVVTLKAHTPHKIIEMRIPSPPIQEVIPLKPFPAQRIVTTLVPSQEIPIQQVVTLQLAPVHRVVEIPVPTAPISANHFSANRPFHETHLFTGVTALSPNCLSFGAQKLKSQMKTMKTSHCQIKTSYLRLKN